MKKRLVFMGTPEFAVPSLGALAQAADFDVVGVFTQPDRPAGRGRKIVCSAVKSCADELALPVFQPEKLRSPEGLAQLAGLRPDIIVVIAYGQIMPAAVLEMPAHGCVNVHASLLPKYRGAAPIHRAVLDGEPQSGVCIMLMDEGIDTGPVLARRATEIGAAETTGELHDRLKIIGAELLLETLPKWIDGRIVAEPQTENGASYAKKIARADERLDWNMDDKELRNRVRGLTPWPGAFTTLGGKVVKIWKMSACAGGYTGTPGTVVEANRSGIYIRCANGCVVIEELQIEGHTRQAAAAVVNGGKICKGDCFD